MISNYRDNFKQLACAFLLRIFYDLDASRDVIISKKRLLLFLSLAEVSTKDFIEQVKQTKGYKNKCFKLIK